MKAIVYSRYGGPEVLEVREVPKPVPREDEVLIRIRATTVTSGDWRARSLDAPAGFGLMSRLFFGITGPRQPILGTELAGEVEAVGKAVTRFKAGDAVFGFTGAAMGCHAEYRCMPERGPLAHKPSKLTYEEAAAISFGGTTALSFLRRAEVRRGDRVLVNGASGAVGTAAVQLAKHFGAEVTGVCSAGNLELVRSLGADAAIDYATEDFTRNGVKYDVILDTAGTAPFSRSEGSLREGGRLVLVLASLPELLSAPWSSWTSKRKIIAGPVTDQRSEDLGFLAALVEEGKLRLVIDRRYPFDRAAEAHRHVDTGHKRGSVVLTLDEDLARASHPA